MVSQETDTYNVTSFDCTFDCSSGINNATSTVEPYIPHTERPEIYLVPLLFAIIFIIGFVGNGSLIYFFFKYPRMRNPPNTYIISLALGDLMVILFCVPFVSTIYTTRSWPFGEIICRLQETVRDISNGVTVFTLTALSAERYFAIVKPVPRRTDATHWALTFTIVIWISSLFLSLPASFLSHVRKFPTSDGNFISVCTPFPEWFQELYPIVIVIKMFLFYLIPLIIIATFYCLMAQHLVAATNALPGEATQQHHRLLQIAARRKVAQMVLALVFIFAICFLPNYVFLMWFYFNPTAKQDFNYFWNVFRIVGFCLAFLNSCINPLTLYCISGTFRKHFNHLLCQSCGFSFEGRSLIRPKLHSSRTDQIDMSILNGAEKCNV